LCRDLRGGEGEGAHNHRGRSHLGGFEGRGEGGE
jgi:hypothetical protein